MCIEYEKAFDSINKTKMWNIMKKYGIKHITDFVKQSYDGDTCQVVHDGRLPEPIPTAAGVKQGYILSPMLFLMVMDKVMRNVTEGEKRAITWGLSQLTLRRRCLSPISHISQHGEKTERTRK
jgi:hypothetical protein